MCVVMRKLRKQVREMGQVQTGVNEPQITYANYTWSTNTVITDTNYGRWYEITDV